jgi:carbonic anhydrase
MTRIGISSSMVLVATLSLFPPQAQGQEANVTPAAALKLLKEGNNRFASDLASQRDVTNARRKELAKGQRPHAVVLACADSRVTPELILDQGLGEIFVLRVAGNVTDQDLIGSIEFAVAELKTPLVVVLGHQSCGAVKAALSGERLQGNLAGLIAKVHVGKVAREDGKTALADAIRHNVLYQVEELSRRSALIKEFIDRGRVGVAAGVYSLDSGRVQWLDLPRKP